MNRASSIATISGALLVANGRLTASAQPSPTTIRVGVTPIDSVAPVVYAMRTGMFEKAGLKIELTTMGSGNAISEAVAGGALDIGLSSLVAIIQGHLRGIPFCIIAPGGLWVDSDTAGLVVAATSPLKNAKDFNGKTISTNALQSLDTVAMQAWSDQNGGDSKTLRFFELPALAATAALQQGRVDGAILSNPAYAAAEAGGARSVAHIYDAVAREFSLGVYFTTTQYADNNRFAAQGFSRVVADAAAYTLDHPSATVDDIAQITKLDREIILHMRRQKVGTVVRVADIQPVIDASAKYKFIATAFPATDLISSAAAR